LGSKEKPGGLKCGPERAKRTERSDNFLATNEEVREPKKKGYRLVHSNIFLRGPPTKRKSDRKKTCYNHQGALGAGWTERNGNGQWGVVKAF